MKKLLKIAVPMDSRSRLFFLKRDLVVCLQSQGVQILPLLYDESLIEETLAISDGVLIPGGVCDVDPALYGEKKKYSSVKINRARCDFEYALLQKALSQKKPLLCICWGLQVLNVYLGGTLVQDLEEDRKSGIKHRQPEPVHLATKWVKFVAGGEAERIFGAAQLFVNSTHHQGIDRIASSVAIEGHSEDGLVECFRLKDHPFGWAVQWHPERLVGDPVIPAFLKACRHSNS